MPECLSWHWSSELTWAIIDALGRDVFLSHDRQSYDVPWRFWAGRVTQFSDSRLEAPKHMSRNEADTRAQLIDPRLEAAGL